MKLFAASLKADIDNKLKTIHLKTNNPIKATEYSIKLLVTALEKLKTSCLQHCFQNKTEEIEFFRDIKPVLAAELIYYNEIYTIQTNEPLGSKKSLRKYYTNELSKLENYFYENLAFYRYYYSNNRNLDNKYFIRGKHDLQFTLDSFYFQADKRFSTSHDYKVAQILANEKIKKYLQIEITKIDTHLVPRTNTQFKPKKWTGSKVGLVELIYALQAEGVFNNGDAELKELINFFEQIFEVNLGQFNRVFLEIRTRKLERTLFLNKLKERLSVRMDEADNKY